MALWSLKSTRSMAVSRLFSMESVVGIGGVTVQVSSTSPLA